MVFYCGAEGWRYIIEEPKVLGMIVLVAADEVE
jgi:hypothetical protein